MNIKLTKRAERRIEIVDQYWRANRPEAPDLLKQELSSARLLLVQDAYIGGACVIQNSDAVLPLRHALKRDGDRAPMDPAAAKVVTFRTRPRHRTVFKLCVVRRLAKNVAPRPARFGYERWRSDRLANHRDRHEEPADGAHVRHASRRETSIQPCVAACKSDPRSGAVRLPLPCMLAPAIGVSSSRESLGG